MTASKNPRTKLFKILSIDGGGVRGILPAKILSLMQEKNKIKIHDEFDMLVGTSTGSIIAAAIATGRDLEKLAQNYKKYAPDIFKKRWRFGWGIYKSKYSSKLLEKFLIEEFGKTTLGEINKPLIINATNVSVGDVHIFKSSYQRTQRNGDYVRDSQVPLYKAVLASCSAPTYFDPVNINGTLICDGGIWANNPSLVGYVDAIKNFQANNRDIRILSLGTGHSHQIYQTATKWGFLTGWQKTKLVDFAMSCQTEFPQNALFLMNSSMICRISPNIPDSDYAALDNHKSIPMLEEVAKSEFARCNEKTLRFLTNGD